MVQEAKMEVKNKIVKVFGSVEITIVYLKDSSASWWCNVLMIIGGHTISTYFKRKTAP